MSDSKKYYYLKLKDNFFESDEMILLESLPDGYLYSNILLKLYLKSLKYEGRLALNGYIPYSTQMLAKVTRHSDEMVEKAIETFNEYGLIEVLDSGIIYMSDIQNFIGSSSTEADRVRAYRAQIKAEKDAEQKSVQMYDNRTPEKEIETEKEIEIENRDRDTRAPAAEKPNGLQENRTVLKKTDFEQFWELYPKKTGKQAALDSWSKIKPDSELYEKIIRAVTAARETEQWKIEGGRFIPNPATWLNQGRWDDEPIQAEQRQDPTARRRDPMINPFI